MTSQVFDAEIGELTITGGRREIVFIEDNVADYQTIAANAGAGRQVVILDSSRDGLQQIADAVKGMSGIDALHVVTHGAEGRIGLGALSLDAASAAEHKDLLAAIGSSMTADGDMLFYGCSVGAGQGADLVGQLAIATGADVAASSNPTGAASLGGDWNLEVASGGIETAPFVDRALAAQYLQLLGAGRTLQFNAASTDVIYGSDWSTGYQQPNPGADLSYVINGPTAMVFNGQSEGVAAYDNGYISFAGNSIETRITISLNDGQVFTPTSVDLNVDTSAQQTLVLTGLNASGTAIVSQEVTVSTSTFAIAALNGFTDIKTLVITPKTGAIKYFQMDNLVLSSVGPLDTTPPTLAITSDKSALKMGETANITFTFSEDPGATFIRGDIAVSGGILGSLSGTGLTRSAVFTPSAGINGGTASITVATNKYADASGNVNVTASAVTLTVDNVAPSVSISSSPSVLKAGETALITFTFTEDPGSSFTSADVSYTSGSLGPISGSGTMRNATFTPTPNVNNGTATISVIANSYADAAGNPGDPGAGPTISYDTQAPALTITSSKPALKAGETATITFSFSEDPGSSFTWNGSSGDVVISGGTLSAISGSGLTRTATFTPTANVDGGTAGISVNAGQYVDTSGNAGLAASTPAVTYDTRAPGAPPAPDLDVNDDSGSSGTDNITSKTTLQFNGSTEAGVTTVKLYDTDGVTEIGNTSSITGTAWAITAAGLSNGAHTITAKAFDAAGNVSGASAGLTVTVDRVPPAVSISSDKSTLKAGDTATITFTFTEDPGSSFSWDGSAGDLAVSGGTLSAISGTGLTRTATFTPNANVDAGTASITVSGAYEDTAGNAGSPGATPSISFDTLAPNAPSVPDLAGGDDSGSSNTDNVTNDPTTTFSGTADAGTTVRLYDGAAEIGSIIASGGNWSIPIAGLGEGSHTLTARAFDAAGNASAASGVLNLVVDRTPSGTSVGSAQLSDDTGASSTDMVTVNGTQTISGTLGANLAAGEQVMVSTNNGATWTAATASAGTNTWELAAATLGGSGILQVRVIDAAGNAGAPWTHAYTIDTTAPAAPSTPDLDTGSDSGSSHTDDITSVTQPAFSGTGESGATVRLYHGAIEIGSGVVAADGTWHIATGSGTPLVQGSHGITARATDLAGNTGAASAALTVQVITGGPSTGIAGMALSSDSGAAGDFITREQTQTISGLLDSVLAAGERVQFSLDQGAHWTDAASAAGSKAWSFPATLTEGTHDIQVRVLDAVDNPGPVHTQAYTLDSLAPALAISSGASTLKAGETALITFTFSEDPGTSFSWDGSAGSVSVSGGTLSALSGAGLVRTATFTPAAATNSGTASISVDAARYHDAAGNGGTAGVAPALHFDTLAPAAASTPDLDKDSDSGASSSDNLTHDTALVLAGTAEAGATVRLYDSGGATEIGHATATGGNWTITTSTLADGSHTVTARVFDAAGNASAASGALTVTIDAARPAAMAAPALAAGSDSGAPGDGVTRAPKPTLKGSAEAFAQVTLYDGAAALGSVTADAQGAWEFTPAAALPDGVHAIAARQADRAGNQSDAGTVFSLTIDTVAPAAPGTPALQAASDTGAIGDGITENNLPVIEGTALANALVTLYDTAGTGKVKVGAAMADGTGKWSIQTTGLGYDTHTLSATQQDAAGNESAASAAFLLRIDEPPAPLNLVDGVAVDIYPISLPGGVNGTAVSIPLVGSGRVESSGSPGVADIPLVTSDTGTSLLLAQVAPGYGLAASGASVPRANGAELLLAAIKAATPAHAAADQGHLTGNGQTFLHAIGSSGSLLVETVKPVSAPTPAGVLTLSAQAAGTGQSTALVIDAGGLAGGATVALEQVNFAAVIGAANVVSHNSMILSGDAASQHFTIVAGPAGATGAVLAGGGDDTLALAPSTGYGSMMLHGGSGSDVAVFSGARADYDIVFHNGSVAVYDKSEPVLAIVVNVEQLKFSDASVAVQNSPDMGTLAGIYQTVLGRQADLTGIEFWADGHQAGASWGAIALGIIGSSERMASHEGFNGVATHDITLLYSTLFNRAPDAEGLAFWTAAMAHGASLERIATDFVQSAEMVGHQRAVLDWDFITI